MSHNCKSVRGEGGFLCCILGKDVPFVPVAMQHCCVRRRTSVAKVRVVRDKGVRCPRQRCAQYATRMCAVRDKGAHYVRRGARCLRVFTTDRERLPCGKMVRIFKSVFVPGLQYLLRTICFQIYLRDAVARSGIIYPGSPPSLMVLLV